MTKKTTLKKYRDEIKKNWELSNDKLIALLDKQLNKHPGGLFEKSGILGFFLRYVEINKHHFVNQKAIVPLTEDDSSTNTDYSPGYDYKFTQVWEWIIKQRISFWKEFFLVILKAETQLKEWIDEEYEINFYQHAIKEIEDQLENESTSGDDSYFVINQQFKKGNYPNVFTTNPDKISEVEAMIAFRKYLKERIADKLPPIQTNQITIQGEINTDKDAVGNLIITLPLKQIAQSIKDELKDEPPKATPNAPTNEIKLFTRKKTADILGVSLQTLNEWSKKGVLKKHRIGNKQVRYRKEDIEKALTSIKTYSFNLQK
jgi:excisionase family DNA binding protein